MNTKLEWKGKMRFDAEVGGHLVALDAVAPIGDGDGVSPKNLVLATIGGCTGMDVAALMKKHRQNMTAFTMEVEAPTSDSHPRVFTKAHVKYFIEGEVEPARAEEAVRLSMTQYCGVSAMFVKAAPITYEIFLNGQNIGQGEAQF